MNNEAQRIAIAEACGWKRRRWSDRKGYECTGWDAPDGRKLVMGPPDYLNDLNAMHEAEGSLSDAQLMACWTHAGSLTAFNDARRYYASAAQRAEAFLRTVNKWDDTK